MTYWPAAIQMNNSVGWQKHLFFLLSLTREPFVPAFPQVTFDNFSPISIVSFCLQLWAFIVKSRQYLFLNCSFIFVTFFLGVVLTLKRFLAVFTIFTRCFAFTAIPLHFCFSFRHNAKLLHSRSAIDIKIWNLTLLHLLAPRQTHLCDFCLVTQTLSIGDKIITQCNIGKYLTESRRSDFCCKLNVCWSWLSMHFRSSAQSDPRMTHRCCFLHKRRTLQQTEALFYRNKRKNRDHQ